MGRANMCTTVEQQCPTAFRSCLQGIVLPGPRTCSPCRQNCLYLLSRVRIKLPIKMPSYLTWWCIGVSITTFIPETFGDVLFERFPVYRILRPVIHINPDVRVVNSLKLFRMISTRLVVILSHVILFTAVLADGVSWTQFRLLGFACLFWVWDLLSLSGIST